MHRDDWVEFYFHLGLGYNEILLCLLENHNYPLSRRQLTRILRSRNLWRKKYFSSIDNIAVYLIDQITSSGQMHGYRWMHTKCIQNGYTVTQETVRMLLKIVDPDGVKLRQKRRLRRRIYSNKGPNFLWHLDSYDKLKPYGICINACTDGFSRHIMWLEARSTNSDPRVIGGFYLKTIEQLQGCPRCIRSDLGTENGHVATIQKLLRSHFNPSAENSCFIYGPSTANQRIESWWCILRKENAQFWMNFFEEFKENGFFNGSLLDKELIRFCFMKLIQEELNEVLSVWNSHRIRKSKNAKCPGGRPIVLYTIPFVYDTHDYLYPIDNTVINVCREECLFLEYPCDEDIFELCNDIMLHNNLSIPDDACQAAILYKKLRAIILTIM